MENQHLTYFKVENFKKFDSLEVKDIGQFNLIVGDNNVGKTCLLEALLVDEDSAQLLNNFYIGLTKRGFKFQIKEVTTKIGSTVKTETIYPKENYFKKIIFGKLGGDMLIETIINDKKKSFQFKNYKNQINELSSESNYLVKGIPLKDYNNQLIHYKYNNQSFTFWIYDYDEKILNFPLISFNDTPLELESRSIYENFKTKREKQILIDFLKIINQKIVDVELRENFDDFKNVFLLSFEDKEELLPLNYLGDGFKRIFYIILKSISLKGKRLMIDEVEIGIHHSKQKEFFINLFKTCKELDFQLFATTHSKECEIAFAEALKEIEEEKNGRLISLQEEKNGIKAYVYSIQNLDFDYEYRG